MHLIQQKLLIMLTLLDLAWKVDDLSRLSTSGRSALVEISSLKELFEDANTMAMLGGA